MTNARKYKLSVCVQPLYFYTEFVQFVQFMEMWMQNGAEHFFIYVQSMSEEVKRVADMYTADGVLTLIDWPHLPGDVDEQVRSFSFHFDHTVLV
jgi:hypothetical protein